jgi:hypothetical protein
MSTCLHPPLKGTSLERSWHTSNIGRCTTRKNLMCGVYDVEYEEVIIISGELCGWNIDIESNRPAKGETRPIPTPPHT